MINPMYLRELIVKPTLHILGMWSPAAENLLLGTAAIESGMGKALKQYGTGPALGVWQVEPFTHADTWKTWLRYKPDIAMRVKQIAPQIYHVSDEEVPVDAHALVELSYGCAIARIKYRRAPEPLPAAEDWKGLELYHKKYYNTLLGKTKIGEFTEKCKQCGLIE